MFRCLKLLEKPTLPPLGKGSKNLPDTPTGHLSAQCGDCVSTDLSSPKPPLLGSTEYCLLSDPPDKENCVLETDVQLMAFPSYLNNVIKALPGEISHLAACGR